MILFMKGYCISLATKKSNREMYNTKVEATTSSNSICLSFYDVLYMKNNGLLRKTRFYRTQLKM